MKRCASCEETLPVDRFWRRAASPDGLNRRCKSCAAARLESWRDENPDRTREYNRRARLVRDSVRDRTYRERYRTPEWRERENAKARERRISDPEYAARKGLADRLRKYNVTPEQFHAMTEQQGGVCPCCERRPDVLVVDHDHACCPSGGSCGRCVRGLLCRDCNWALGLVGDDPATLARMVDYLATRSVAVAEDAS